MEVSGTSMICVLAYNALYVYTLESVNSIIIWFGFFRIVEVKEEGRIKLLWGTRKADKLVYFKNRVQEFGTEYGWGGSEI